MSTRRAAMSRHRKGEALGYALADAYESATTLRCHLEAAISALVTGAAWRAQGADDDSHADDALEELGLAATALENIEDLIVRNAPASSGTAPANVEIIVGAAARDRVQRGRRRKRGLSTRSLEADRG